MTSRRGNRRRHASGQKRGPSGTAIALAISVVILVGGVLVGLQLTAQPNANATPGAAATIDGIPCGGSEILTSHIHSHFEILVNGQAQTAPAGVGIMQANQCLYWLHTHAADGIIHEESPANLSFTLGQFFDIWHRPLSNQKVGDVSGPVTYYVNGKLYSGDPRKISLVTHADIVAEVGTPVVPPPPYTEWKTSSAGD